VVAANARKLKTGAKIAANKESYKAIGLFEDAVFPQVKNRRGLNPFRVENPERVYKNTKTGAHLITGFPHLTNQ
jgi:hypothetical protein